MAEDRAKLAAIHRHKADFKRRVACNIVDELGRLHVHDRIAWNELVLTRSMLLAEADAHYQMAEVLSK